MFAHRETLISRIELEGGLDPAVVERIQAVESRVLSTLQERRGAVLREMRDQAKERSASSAYRNQNSTACLDRVG